MNVQEEQVAQVDVVVFYIHKQATRGEKRRIMIMTWKGTRASSRPENEGMMDTRTLTDTSRRNDDDTRTSAKRFTLTLTLPAAILPQ
jgi:hypothetical protein